MNILAWLTPAQRRVDVTTRTAICDSTGIRLMDGGEQVAMILWKDLLDPPPGESLIETILAWIDHGTMPIVYGTD